MNSLVVPILESFNYNKWLRCSKLHWNRVLKVDVDSYYIMSATNPFACGCCLKPC